MKQMRPETISYASKKLDYELSDNAVKEYIKIKLAKYNSIDEIKQTVIGDYDIIYGYSFKITLNLKTDNPWQYKNIYADYFLEKLLILGYKGLSKINLIGLNINPDDNSEFNLKLIYRLCFYNLPLYRFSNNKVFKTSEVDVSRFIYKSIEEFNYNYDNVPIKSFDIEVEKERNETFGIIFNEATLNTSLIFNPKTKYSGIIVPNNKFVKFSVDYYSFGEELIIKNIKSTDIVFSNDDIAKMIIVDKRKYIITEK